MEEIQEHTETDPVLQRIIEAIIENQWNNIEIPKTYKQIKDELTVSNGIILRQLRIVIPEGLRKKMFRLSTQKPYGNREM